MKTPLLLAALLLATSSRAQITLTATRTTQANGWMRGGWGNYRFVLKNDGPAVTIVSWKGHWEADGKTMGGPWGGDLDLPLASGAALTRDEVGYLPPEVAEAAEGKAAEMVGTFTVQNGAEKRELPYRFAVPEAVLPERLKLIKGKTVGIALMESRYRDFKTAKRALKWVDDCYAAMIDLTGQRPFGGKLMVYREAPEHPWWAYAGQEMILNTKFVGQTLKDFDNGILSFGWVHEVGHNFDDGIGDWYNWSGPCAEFQANFKLAYAVSRPSNQGFRMKWRNGAPAYGDKRPEIFMTGKELDDKFFGLFGDAYLADPKRTWDTLSSDETQTLFHRLVEVYGWDPFKAWYRTYRRLTDAGMKPPAAPEEKINLAAAILIKETGGDLIPTFQMWRLPINADSVARMAKQYRL
jgi:hypothetical protein